MVENVRFYALELQIAFSEALYGSRTDLRLNEAPQSPQELGSSTTGWENYHAGATAASEGLPPFVNYNTIMVISGREGADSLSSSSLER